MSGRYVSCVLESDLVADLKFTAVVLASFADEQGYQIRPAMPYVAYLRGLKERRVQDHVKELRAMEILTIVRAATQWLPTHYRMQLEKLPTRAAYKPSDRQSSFLGQLGESPGPSDSGVQLAAPLSGVQPVAPGVQPTAPDPSVRSSSTHTYDPRARGDADARATTAEGESPLPLIVPPRRDPDHAAHAWCGRICVPKFLHKAFKRALGGPVTKRAARMRNFYAETLNAIPSVQPIGAEPVKFWRAAFAARYGGAAPKVYRRADGIAARGLTCPHDPICTDGRCVERQLTAARTERERTG